MHDQNSIIQNVGVQLSTTANKLIPERSFYHFANHSIWLAISIIFIGVCIGLTIRLLWMHKKDGEMLAIYPELVRKLDQQLRDSGMMDGKLPSYTHNEWLNTLDSVRRVRGTMQWDESTWCCMIVTAVWSGLIGIVIFGVALYHIIGWCIAPNASAFMWIIGQLGGGQ